MKVFPIICLVLLTGCVTTTEHSLPPYTSFTRYENGDVQSIRLLLRITSYERQNDGSFKIMAQGVVENNDFRCVLLIPAKWDDYMDFRDLKQANIIFIEDGPGGAELDSLVQRYMRNRPSVFANAGFNAIVAANAVEKIERNQVEFHGMAPFDGYGHLGCLLLVDVPDRVLKVAFQTMSFGSGPQSKEDYEWIKAKTSRAGSP